MMNHDRTNTVVSTLTQLIHATRMRRPDRERSVRKG